MGKGRARGEGYQVVERVKGAVCGVATHSHWLV